VSEQHKAEWLAVSLLPQPRDSEGSHSIEMVTASAAAAASRCVLS